MAENRELALVLKLVADQFQSELKKSGGMLGDMQKIVLDWRTQLAAAGAALFALTKSTADYGDQLVKMSQRMGTSVEDTARLQHAAKLSDLDLQGLSSTVGFLAKNMLEAASGNAEAQQTFFRLGLGVTDANGNLKSTTDILLELNDKFRLMPDGPEKTALAMKALGKSGKEVLPFLNSDLRAAFEEADKLGLVMSEKDAKAAEHFNDELTKLQGAIRGVTNDIGTALLPKFDALVHALTTIVTDARAAFDALTGLGKLDAPQPGVVRPQEGGRNLRILPAPPGIEKAQVDRVIPTEADLKKLQEDYRLYITGLTAMGQERLDKEKASYALYIQGLTAMGEEYLAKQKDNYQLYIAGLTAAGEQYQNSIKGTGDEAVKLFQEHHKDILKERDLLIENERAWISYGDQLGAWTEFMVQHRMDLIRLELAKELDLNQDQAGKLLLAWQNHDEELAASQLARVNKTATEIESIQLRTLAKSKQTIAELSGDFLEGWAQGLRRYALDQTMFGLASDMARRFFQTTEQGIQRFLFDAAEGRLQRLRDVAKSILSIVNQLVSQMASQVLMRGIAGAFANAAPGLFNFGGGSQFTGDILNPVRQFATGGSFMVGGSGGVDSQLVAFRASPNERVTVETPEQQRGGQVNVIINNYGQNTDVQASAQRGPDGRQMVYVTVRDMLKGMIQGGEMDSPFSRRFGLTPAPGRR